MSGAILPEGSLSPKPPKGSCDTRTEDLSAADLVENLLLKANCDTELAIQLASHYTAFKRRKTEKVQQINSDLTTWSVFRKYVTGSQPRFKCHRPLPPPVPLVLLHKPFKKFYDDLNEEPGAADMKFACDYWADLNSDDYVINHLVTVVRVAHKVSEYFNQHFCKDPLAGLAVGVKENRDDSRIDVQVQHLRGPCLVVAEEHKPQAAAGELGFQNMENFRRMWVKFEKQAYAILVNSSGPQQVEVMAASLQEGNRVVWAETLAKFSCHHTAEGRLAELERTARIWKAIKGFAVSYALEEKQGEFPLPWCVRELRNVKQLEREKLVYTYDEVLEGGGMREVFVKVTQRYSEAAHQAWKAVAPELYRVEDINLCLGWKAVHMEYLQPSVWKPAVDVLRAVVEKQEAELLDRFKTLIRSAAEVGHGNGFVHGDFRLDNLLLRESAAAGVYEVRIVDFDWGGKVGEAKFSVVPNPAVKWHKDTFWGYPITKEHDLWFADDGLLPQLEYREECNI